ncbi:MAG: histidine phosphatase family protein [Kofleriaceae bacterium]|nr:histidine phosphatase family protein [Kofleriaceae bacterium]
MPSRAISSSPPVPRCCLLRHAEAVDERRDLYDGARYLSAAGRQAARRAGRQLTQYFAGYLRSVTGLPHAELDAVRIISSPLVRAIQTAELAAAHFGAELDVGCEPLLAPGSDIAELVQRLQRSAPCDLLIVVGHEPGLSALGAELTGDGQFPLLEKAQAAFIENGVLRWLWADHAAAPDAHNR